MSRQRKVHHASKGRPDIALCGVVSGGLRDAVQIVNELQFLWLPKQSQCITCRAARKTKGWACGTQEMIATVECFVLELDRLGVYATAHPHSERGCFHRLSGKLYEHLEPCWCDNVSWLDPAFAERMIAIALGTSDDGYVFRHVCSKCRIAFRTKYPRGPSPTCGFCRGKIDEVINHDEMYNSAFATSDRYRGGEPIGYPARWNGVEE